MQQLVLDGCPGGGYNIAKTELYLYSYSEIFLKQIMFAFSGNFILNIMATNIYEPFVIGSLLDECSI